MSLKNKKIKKMKELEIAAFCRQISMVISAGLPTYYGVSILLEDAEDDETRELLEKIYEPMERGETLYAALKETEAFPEYMLQMIHLGEQTGRLENVLDSLSAYYERDAQIKAGIRHAAFYPLIMTTLMVVVIIVLMTKVLPIFSQIYKELGTDLTGVAKTLLMISEGLNKYLFVIIAVFVLIIVAALLLYNTGLGKVFFQGGKLSMAIAASRFANCMQLALASGLDTDKGLDLAYELVGNPHMQDKIARCKDHIKHGMMFEEALKETGIFTKSYFSMISIGYRTGDMESVMSRISDAYEEETDERIHSIISTIEPTLVIVLCFFVGLILISFLLPLLGIMQSIG